MNREELTWHLWWFQIEKNHFVYLENIQRWKGYYYYLIICFQHMVQNQMTPSYPQFATQTGIEEYQQQQAAAAAIPTQAPVTVTDPQAQFKEQSQPAPVTLTTNGVEQQTVSLLNFLTVRFCKAEPVFYYDRPSTCLSLLMAVTPPVREFRGRGWGGGGGVRNTLKLNCWNKMF